MLSSALRALQELVGTVPDLALRKRAFEERTGAFGPDDPWFEARSAAFLDDVLCGGLARELAPRLDEEQRTYVTPLERAHRGLFRVGRASTGFLLADVWSGVELPIVRPELGVADALASADGFVDGRVVGAWSEATGAEVALLPGAVFHGADATSAVESLLPLARQRSLSTAALLDSLLRMDHALRSLSRVKAAFAYRADALPKRS